MTTTKEAKLHLRPRLVRAFYEALPGPSRAFPGALY